MPGSFSLNRWFKYERIFTNTCPLPPTLLAGEQMNAALCSNKGDLHFHKTFQSWVYKYIFMYLYIFSEQDII